VNDIDDNFPTVDSLKIIRPWGYYGYCIPVCVRIYDTTAQTAANYTAPFFIADRQYQLIEVFERHEALGTDGGAVTVMLTKVPSGTAPASGTNMLSAGINLKATANTNQKGTLGTTITSITLARGDSMALVTTGTLTAVKGVTVAVVLKAN